MQKSHTARDQKAYLIVNERVSGGVIGDKGLNISVGVDCADVLDCVVVVVIDTEVKGFIVVDVKVVGGI